MIGMAESVQGQLVRQSLVAVSAESGERIWHFQTVHHGLWDYDLPAAPTLVDITVDSRYQGVRFLSRALLMCSINYGRTCVANEKDQAPSQVPGEVASLHNHFRRSRP